MADLFISHSSADDDFVRRLRQRLEEHGVRAWTDSRELLPGGLLEPDIKIAIENSSAFAVVVSPNSLQSTWVGKELRFSLEVQHRRGNDRYAVIPLSLDGTKLGALESFFDGEPIYISVSSATGGVDAAIHSLLVALGRRLPTDTTPAISQVQQPLEELRLELADFVMETVNGSSCASARARLVYESEVPDQLPIVSPNSWRIVAPLGATELGELHWYLDEFARWPYEHFRRRAQDLESNLVRWGKELHDAALPANSVAQLTSAWYRLDVADRRFSIFVGLDGVPESGTGAPALTRAEIAARFLTLPWELLHDGEKHIVAGSHPVCVRRRVPSTRPHEAAIVSPPIRVLIVSPRPEDDTCKYFDHRASTLPLVDALEQLGDLVQLRVLMPPTFIALHEELDRARSTGEPYHVVHFDAFATVDKAAGLASLCFEDPQDLSRLSKRRHTRVEVTELGALLCDRRVPVVFLDAHWAAPGHFIMESIAAELLRVGVGSIVTTREPALPDAARRFVTGFYRTLAGGNRIGDAVLKGQRQLMDDAFRGVVPGAGETRVRDWFNPILYQNKDDPQLFYSTPSRQTKADIRTGLRTRFGQIPEPPQGGFVGRSRQLLALERLLQEESYAVVRGQVGSGKTAVAVELARWMVRSHRVERAALVTLGPQTTPKDLLVALVDQLIGYGGVFDASDDFESWFKQVERALLERSTLIVVDDVHRVLPPPGDAGPENATEHREFGFAAIAAVCQRLVSIAQTRILFAGRERLPQPFDGLNNRLELMPLAHQEAVELVERQIAEFPLTASRDEIDELVDLLYGHAGTLATLGLPLLRSGIAGAHGAIGGFMRELDRRYPGDDHRSPFSGIEHSLSRMSTASQARSHVLAPFQGGVESGLLVDMTGWSADDVRQLMWELIESGLATPLNESYLALVPGLSSCLRGKTDSEEWADLETRWQQAIRSYGAFLVTTGRQDAIATSKRFALDIPNFLGLLEYDERVGDATMTINTATSLIGELSSLGKRALVDRVTGVLRATVENLKNDWSHEHFAAYSSRVSELLQEGRITNARDGASSLIQLAKLAGVEAYENADLDIAMACYLMGRAFEEADLQEEALSLFDEARSRFETVRQENAHWAGVRMAISCALKRASCLAALNRFDEAATLYERTIEQLTELKEEHDLAVAVEQLGTVRRRQGRFDEALAAFATAQKTFSQLNEPAWTAHLYGESGKAYVELGRFEEAETAYHEALKIWALIGDKSGEARQLEPLASLYADHLQRPQEAIAFYKRAADTFAELGDVASEAYTRNNLADFFSQLGRFDAGRTEIERAIECKKPFGHSLQPWTSWDILSRIEGGAGNPTAAATAQQTALDAYLAFRRGGGKANGPRKLTAEIERKIQADGPAAALEFLRDVRARDDSSAELQSFCDVLGKILNGNHDPAIVAAAGLNYAATAEALLFVEHLAAR